MLGKSMRRRRGRGPETGHSRKRWKAPSAGTAGKVVLAGVAAVLAGWGTGYLYATHVAFPGPEIHVSGYTEIPSLLGLALEEAQGILAEQGLETGAVDSIHHPAAGWGQILGQSPLPGQLGIPGGEVELTISLGPEERPVPDVTRFRADRALIVLQTTGFQVAVDSSEAWMPPGRVVETEPQAGAMLTLPGEVRMTVSLGPPMVTMPNLVGLQEEQARTILDSLGLVVGEVETAFRFGFNQGEVLEHAPRPDSLVARGGEVRLVIGRRSFFRDRDEEGRDREIPEADDTEVPEARDENRTEP